MNECVIQGTTDLPKPGARLPEVIAWCKAHRELMESSQLGRVIMAAIDANNMKKLKKYWVGKK